MDTNHEINKKCNKMIGSERWLEVQAEPGTCAYTLSQCLALVDLQADGDFKLVIADMGPSQFVLKVLKGMSVIAETTLAELPSGLVTLYNDNRHPRIPVIAVASGPSLYVYRNLKPYYKFSLPATEVNALEQDLWLQMRNGGIEAKALYEMLASLQQDLGFSSMSQETQRLLTVAADNEQEIKFIVASSAGNPLTRKTVITCLTTLQKSSTDEDSVCCLIVGAEDGSITIVDSEAFTVILKVDQREDHGTRTVPVQIEASGLLDVEFRILVCNRDAKITLLRRGWTSTKVLVQMAAQPINFVLLENLQIVVATYSTLECYSKKGRQQWELPLPHGAISLTKIYLAHQSLTLVAVALDGGHIYLYNGRNLVDVINAPDNVTAMTFGKFGQEDHCLVLVTAGGTLLVKMLKRTAQFTSTEIVLNKQPVPKLPIPKRTKLIIEQVARERENAIDMHQSFQRGLFRLRLEAARTLAQSKTKSSNLISTNSKLPIKMAAQVFGLGPTFKLRLTLDNMASNLTENIPRMRIYIQFNHGLYQVSEPCLDVPPLIPGLVYVLETMVRTVGEVLIAEDVMVYLVTENSSKPVLSTAVHIPVCDVLPIEI